MWTILNLWDANGGGFFDSTPNPDAAGLLAIPHKEILDTPASSGNAVAAQVLNRLYYLTQEKPGFATLLASRSRRSPAAHETKAP